MATTTVPTGPEGPASPADARLPRPTAPVSTLQPAGVSRRRFALDAKRLTERFAAWSGRGVGRASWDRGRGLALLPVCLVGLGAAMPPLRLPALLVVVAGTVVAVASWERAVKRGVVASALTSRWAWAAPLPVAASLAWGLLPAPLAAPDGSDCGSPLSPPAIWRFGEAVVVLLVLAAAAASLRSSRRELGLRRPTRAVLGWSVVGLVVLGPLSVIIGPWFATPFFGPVSLGGAANLGALVPALTFAVANGTMEELAYRGALQAWLSRVVGPATALGAQAVLFGLQHSVGAEFTSSSLPVVAAMVGGGLVAGLIVRRTGSLALPIALHVAFDIPLYYYWACRF